jgi:hypothetical protein
MQLLSKKLLKGTSFQELVEELEKLENARSVNKICQSTMMSKSAVSA